MHRQVAKEAHDAETSEAVRQDGVSILASTSARVALRNDGAQVFVHVRWLCVHECLQCKCKKHKELFTKCNDPDY